MSIARNNLVREVAAGRSVFASLKPVLSTSCTWNQGDLIAYDNTNKILNAVTGTGSSGLVVGVAVNTIVDGVMPSPYQGTAVDASQAIEDAAGPLYGCVFNMNMVSGDSWQPGQKAYLTADPQTLTSAVTGGAVGIYQGQPVTSAVTDQSGDFLIGCPYSPSGVNF
jgi:hypothetical protein